MEQFCGFFGGIIEIRQNPGYLHSVCTEKNTELILDELGEMSDRVRELDNRADVDRDVARAMTNRMHELLRLLRGAVQDSEEQLEILNEIRSRFLPPRFTIVRDVDTDTGRPLRGVQRIEIAQRGASGTATFELTYWGFDRPVDVTVPGDVYDHVWKTGCPD